MGGPSQLKTKHWTVFVLLLAIQSRRKLTALSRSATNKKRSEAELTSNENNGYGKRQNKTPSATPLANLVSVNHVDWQGCKARAGRGA